MDRKNRPLLIAQNGIINDKQWFLDEGMLIGRDQECDLVIDDRQVSRKHARVYQTSEGVFLEDLESKNGTYVNHKRVEGVVQLFEGDVVQIALIQQFLFVSSDATIPLSEAKANRLIYLDQKNKTVWVGDEKIDPPLSVQQYALLNCLYEKAGNIVSRIEIISRVWPHSVGMGVSDEAIDALVRRLRYRLAEYDKSTEFIETVRGYGFRLKNPNKK